MKTLTTLCAIVAASVCLATAQTVSETVTTTAPTQAMGTVTTFGGDSIIVSGADSTPVTYGYTKSTTIVDEMGNPVAVDVVRSGAPVTVYYSPIDGRMVASKVVVRKAVTPVIEQRTERTTTTTTTE